MKQYKFCLIIIIVASSNILNGQSKFDFGAEVSVIRNNYKIVNSELNQGIFRSGFVDHKATVSFNFRITYKVDQDNSLVIAPGIRYFAGFNESDIANHNGTFLDLPLYLNINVSKDFFFIAGLRLSYLTKLERTDSFVDFDPPRGTNLLVSAERRIFYMPKVGIGIKVFKNLGFELSYNKSLSNLVKIDNSLNSLGIPSEIYKNDFYELSVVFDGLASLFSKK